MTPTTSRPRTVTATAIEVLPSFGIAYLIDDHDMAWAVTKSTRGQGLQSLRPGQRVELTLDYDRDFSLVSAYRTLD